MVAAAMVGSSAIGAVGSAIGGSKQSSAASDAAQMQSDAAAQMRADLQPYSQIGQQAVNPLFAAMGYGANLQGINPNSPLQQQFQFDPNQVQYTPGYQFAMQQGLNSVQNQMSAQGLGLSGAQIKGAQSFATGLANQTYGDQYNRALSTYNTNYQTAANNANRLQALVNMGQNSAAQQGQAGIQGAAGAGNYLTQAGNAQAGGIMGVSNAAGNGLNNYMMYNALYPSASQGPSFGSSIGNFLTGG